jgi:hypothetical protein
MSPAGAANLRFAVRDPRTAGEPTQLTSSAPLPIGTEVYVAASYDYTGNSAVLYSNAVEMVRGPAAVPLNIINDVNNWLGRSQWDDGMFTGSYNEFRIWEGALSADRIAANFAAGPNTVPTPSEPPELAIVRADAHVVVSWPNTASGFVLEVAATVGAGSTWTAVNTSGAVDEGGMKKLTLPIGSSNQYYRMRQ